MPYLVAIHAISFNCSRLSATSKWAEGRFRAVLGNIYTGTTKNWRQKLDSGQGSTHVLPGQLWLVDFVKKASLAPSHASCVSVCATFVSLQQRPESSVSLPC